MRKGEREGGRKGKEREQKRTADKVVEEGKPVKEKERMCR